MRSLDETAEVLGEGGSGYRRLLAPLVADADALMRDVLAPAGVPEHPVTFTRFGMRAALPASLLAHTLLRGGAARALFGGLAAHSMLPLNSLFTSAFALMLAAGGHAYGWPVARGGSQRVTDGLVARLRALGGEIRCDSEVRTLGDVPDARVVLFDVTPRQLLDICGDSLPAPYRSRLGRFRYGVGVFKLDWALSDPIPWRAPVCRRAGTVHLGGTLEELAASESAPARGRVAERPFVLLVQPTVCDPSRAPDGRHVGWAYCHVPNGYTGDLTSVIEGQVERFAPGFRDTILARHVLTPAGLQSHNANYIGGDINGGAQDALQLFTRPVARLDPYSTPNPRLFICSSSTPPGGGVHGMCGHHAARSALKRLGVRPPGQ
jgi:phytoene dehydrogenase-like protein